LPTKNMIDTILGPLKSIQNIGRGMVVNEIVALLGIGADKN